MKPNYGLKKNTFTSTVGAAEQHRQDEKTRGGRDPRESGKKPQREAHKRSARLFNFHIRCDIYKLPQQSGGPAGKRGQEERDPGRPHGLLARVSRDHRWGGVANRNLRKGSIFDRI